MQARRTRSIDFYSGERLSDVNLESVVTTRAFANSGWGLEAVNLELA